MIRVFNQYFPVRKIIFFIGECTLIGVAVLASLVCDHQLHKYLTSPFILLTKIAIIMAIYQLSLYFSDFYSAGSDWTYVKVIGRLAVCLLVASTIIPGIYYLTPLELFDMHVLFTIAFFAFILLTPWRIAYSWFVNLERYKEKTLILGSGELARNIAREALKHKDLALDIVGFISNDVSLQGKSIVNPRVIGCIDDLSSIVQEKKVEKIIVAMEERRGQLPVEKLLTYRSLGVRIQEGVDFYEKATNKMLVEHITPSHLIFCESFKLSPLKLFVKRSSDIIIALVGLVVTSPLFLVIPLLIKLETKGSVFFQQERVGKDGKSFNIYKFRTMINNAEKQTGPVMSFKGDKRVTLSGIIFRKTRLDELPQLLNVLRGDMSFVGPRPERPVFVDMFKKNIPFYTQRFALRPGITGWAQIRYPYAASIEETLEKLRYELYYLKNFSFLFDVTIILRTLKVILFTRGSA